MTFIVIRKFLKCWGKIVKYALHFNRLQLGKVAQPIYLMA